MPLDPKLIAETLVKFKGNKTAAAKALGVDRSFFYPKLKRGTTSLVLADIHFPFHSPTVLEAAIAFAHQQHPTHIHLLGDVCDFYSISRFSKDPLRKENLMDDLEGAEMYIARLRREFPRAVILYSEGNHENRLKRYLWAKAPELASVPALSVPRLLHLKKHRVSWYSQAEPYKMGPLLFVHGDRVRKHSAMTAMAHFEKYGCSLLVGHCHRAGHYGVRRGGETWGAWEVPCLCTLEPEYDLEPNWINGWVWITHGDDGRYEVETIQAIKGKYNFRGKTVTYGENA